jgi:hypothetical protein
MDRREGKDERDNRKRKTSSDDGSVGPSASMRTAIPLRKARLGKQETTKMG